MRCLFTNEDSRNLLVDIFCFNSSKYSRTWIEAHSLCVCSLATDTSHFPHASNVLVLLGVWCVVSWVAFQWVRCVQLGERDNIASSAFEEATKHTKHTNAHVPPHTHTPHAHTCSLVHSKRLSNYWLQFRYPVLLLFIYFMSMESGVWEQLLGYPLLRKVSNWSRKVCSSRWCIRIQHPYSCWEANAEHHNRPMKTRRINLLWVWSLIASSALWDAFPFHVRQLLCSNMAGVWNHFIQGMERSCMYYILFRVVYLPLRAQPLLLSFSS